ncbi:MAG: lamin tail domain-containing protein [Verrucomicrobiia bacterium]
MSTPFGVIPCQLFLQLFLGQCAKAFCRSIGLPHSSVLAGLIAVTGMAVPHSGKAAPTTGTLALTEVMAVSQSAVADDDGEYPDWIELFNPSGTAVDLTGWYLTDARSRPTKWSFPGTTLGSGQYLVVFASGKDRRAPDKPLHTSFSLSAEGEYLALVAPDGVSVISELTFPAQRFGYSYGLADGAVGGADQGVFFDQPTPGGPNGLGYAGFARKPEASVKRGFYEQPFAVTLNNHTPGSEFLYTLNGTQPRPAPGVAVSISPADVSGAGDGISSFSRAYPNGTAVTLTAPTVGGGYLFQNWRRNGEAFSSSPTVNVILDSDCVMNAVYAPGPLAPGKVPESAPYTLVYSLSLPDQADYSSAPVPYELDNRIRLGAFTRVAYYMEIQAQGDSSSHFLWASMNAFTTDTGKLGVPTLASGAFFQQAVENLSVRSSLPEIVTGDDLPGGYLEFWPGNYGAENEAGVPGASSTPYDFGDTAGPREQIGYGSMQLHNTVAGQTLFAFNGWGGILSTDADVGIGSFAGGHPDWTFAANAPKLAVKRLQVYVLEPDRSAAITPGTSPAIQALTSQSVAATVQPELRSLMVLASNPESGFAYSGPIEINTTRTLRAASVGPNTYPSEVATETYLFLEDVLRQPASVPGYPNSEMQLYMLEGFNMIQRPVRLDYEMDPDIVSAPAYRDTIRAAMLSIPSLSLVGRADHFFGHEGVYHGVGASGGPEIPVSVELIYPEEPNRNLQVNAGLVPHSWAELKRAFRIILRNDYGSPELETDLFRNAPWNGPTTTDRFRRVVLRAGTNRSFATFWNPDDTCYTRDEWARASQAVMSGQAAHGNFVHLYINGLYWGLYNPVERPDHFFAASYFGGSDEDYFVANHGGPVSGDPSRWTYLTQEVIRKNMATPANYEELKTHVDLQQFCDYLLLNWYSGTADWPENNWYASMRLTPSPTPLRFFVWDAEDIWDAEGSSGPFDLDCTGCLKRGNDGAWIPSDFVQANSSGTGPVIPQLFHSARANPEFLTLLADRAYHHLQAGGALSDAQSQARWTQINEFVREAVIGESARWGDARDTLPGEAGVLRDRDGVWEPEDPARSQ